jgi:hypothetical protein
MNLDPVNSVLIIVDKVHTASHPLASIPGYHPRVDRNVTPTLSKQRCQELGIGYQHDAPYVRHEEPCDSGKLIDWDEVANKVDPGGVKRRRAMLRSYNKRGTRSTRARQAAPGRRTTEERQTEGHPETDATDEEDEVCDLMELPLEPRRYVSDVIRDDISNIEYMRDGTSFLSPISALNRLNLLRQGFHTNVPALWLANQEFTADELRELEQRIGQRVSTNKVDFMLQNMTGDDDRHVLECIRMVRSMGTIVNYLTNTDECPVKGAMEDVCVKLRKDDQGRTLTDDDLVNHNRTRRAV